MSSTFSKFILLFFLILYLLIPWIKFDLALFQLTNGLLVLILAIFIAWLNKVRQENLSILLRILHDTIKKYKVFLTIWSIFLIYLITGSVNYSSDYNDFGYFDNFRDPWAFLPTTMNISDSIELVYYFLFLSIPIAFYLLFRTIPSNTAFIKYEFLFNTTVYLSTVINLLLICLFDIWVKFVIQLPNCEECFGPFKYNNNGLFYLITSLPIILNLSPKISEHSLTNKVLTEKFLFKLMPLCCLGLCFILLVNSNSRLTIMLIGMLILLSLLKYIGKLIVFYRISFYIMVFTILLSLFYYLFNHFVTTNTKWYFLPESNYRNFSINVNFQIKDGLDTDKTIYILADSNSDKFIQNSILLHYGINGLITLEIIRGKRVVYNTQFTLDSTTEPGKIYQVTLKHIDELLEVYLNEKQIITSHLDLGRFIKPNYLYCLPRLENLKVTKFVLRDLDNFQKPPVVFDFEKDIFLNFFRSRYESRYVIIINSINLLQKNIFYGLGSRSWSGAFSLAKDQGQVREAWLHCDPLQILIEFGTIGSFLILLTIYILYLSGRNSQSSTKHKYWWFFFTVYSLLSLLDFPFQVVNLNFALVCSFLLCDVPAHSKMT